MRAPRIPHSKGLYGTKQGAHFINHASNPESRFADLITLSLLAVPCGWIGLSYLKTKFLNPTASAMAAE